MRRLFWLLIFLAGVAYAVRRKQTDTTLAPRMGNQGSGGTSPRQSAPTTPPTVPGPAPPRRDAATTPTTLSASPRLAATEAAAHTAATPTAPAAAASPATADRTPVSEASSITQAAAASDAAEPTGSAAPVEGDCPEGYPIKGNKNSSGDRIYHVPGGDLYKPTVPEACFATEEDAQAAGFRRSRR